MYQTYKANKLTYQTYKANKLTYQTYIANKPTYQIERLHTVQGKHIGILVQTYWCINRSTNTSCQTRHVKRACINTINSREPYVHGVQNVEANTM